MNKYRGDGIKASDPASVPPDLPEQDFEPIGNLVMVRIVPRTESPGGVALPETVQGIDDQNLDPTLAWVVAAGCQCRYARRGDLVMVTGRFVSYRWKGQRLAMLQETQIAKIVQDKDGRVPRFAVTDWKDGIVCRAGEDCDVRPGASVAEVRGMRVGGCNSLPHTAPLSPPGGYE